MTPLIFGPAGIFIDAVASLPQRDEFAPFRLIEQHSVYRRQGRITGSVSENPRLFTTRCSRAAVVERMQIGRARDR
jgi:hypothetical protein